VLVERPVYESFVDRLIKRAARPRPAVVDEAADRPITALPTGLRAVAWAADSSHDGEGDAVTVRDLLRALPVFDRPLPAFDTESVPGTPSALFLSWLHAAIDAGVSEPHAMTLSTVDAEGRPDARVLILKDVDAESWEFATATTSAKGTQLAAVRQAALSFHWREQARQVRVRGAVATADPRVSAADFLAKPDGSRIAGLVGRQSAVLEDPRKLALEIEAAGQRLAQDPFAVAEDHAVYVLTPAEVEFWQGDRQRKHVRLRYRRSVNDWITERLWP
jgi:pyridoxamine 5'-phosphate oxidase